MKKSKLYYFVVGVHTTLQQYKEANVDLKATKKNHIGSLTYGDKTLGVYYAPDINKLAALYAAVSYNPLTKKVYVMVDDYYMGLSAELQNAALWHEMGHYAMGHLDKYNSWRRLWEHYVFLGQYECSSSEEKDLLITSTLHARDCADEIAADAFALENTSQEAVLGLLKTMYRATVSPEVQTRYEHLTGETLESPLASLFDNCEVISVETLEDYAQ